MDTHKSTPALPLHPAWSSELPSVALPGGSGSCFEAMRTDSPGEEEQRWVDSSVLRGQQASIQSHTVRNELQSPSSEG